MESNKKMKITITAIILVVIVAFAIIIGIIVSNIQKENRRKELRNKYSNTSSTNVNNSNYNTNENNSSITNNNTSVTNSNQELLPEPIVLYNQNNIVVKVTKMEYTPSSIIGENLAVTFEIDNQTDQDLTFRFINVPKLNGWSCSSLSRFGNQTVAKNTKQEREFTAYTEGMLNKKEENIKELEFDFTISTAASYMDKKEEQVLYTVKDNKIKTGYYDNMIESPITQNENIGISLYAVQNLDVRANLERTEDGGNLVLKMLNKGYTSPTAVANREQAPAKTSDQNVSYVQQEVNTGDIDYTCVSIQTLKINGIEIGKGFRSSIYGEILPTVGNTVSIENININLKSEDFKKYGIEKIETIELSGKVYKQEKYADNIIVVTQIGEFNDVIVK